MTNRILRPGLTILVCAIVLGQTLTHAADQPNLIAVVTDDQGRWAMGAYGNREIHTPNMDRWRGWRAGGVRAGAGGVRS